MPGYNRKGEQQKIKELVSFKSAKMQMGGNNIPNFGWHVEHQGHNGRVIISVEDEAHFMELSAEVGCILR